MLSVVFDVGMKVVSIVDNPSQRLADRTHKVIVQTLFLMQVKFIVNVHSTLHVLSTWNMTLKALETWKTTVKYPFIIL